VDVFGDNNFAASARSAALHEPAALVAAEPEARHANAV
jgi:hypothetical protein